MVVGVFVFVWRGWVRGECSHRGNIFFWGGASRMVAGYIAIIIINIFRLIAINRCMIILGTTTVVVVVVELNNNLF